MVQTNKISKRIFKTYESGQATAQTALTELTRTIANCLLFENTFYESGNDISKRIIELCNEVSLPDISKLAISARHDLFLRHVPLFLIVQMQRVHSQSLKALKHNYKDLFINSQIIQETIEQCVQRADELCELVSIYYKCNPQTHSRDAIGNTLGIRTTVIKTRLPKNAPLPGALKKGLAAAFTKFSEYQLAKWNQLDKEVKLRDVLFLTHAKPVNDAQGELWKRLINNTMVTPDTWEVALSAGSDKKETWERLLREKKLGYMALLMNLRNMSQVNVDPDIITAHLLSGAAESKALPFRFISAAKHAPMYADVLSRAMVKAVEHLRLDGTTALVIDISGSMDVFMSAKSTSSRWETAAALGILLREITPSCRIFTFSNSLVEVSNIKGIGLIDVINRSQSHGGTNLVHSLQQLREVTPTIDRIIVITDEQSHDGNTQAWGKNNYLINVAPYAPALSLSGGWNRVNGWSPRLLDWISLNETGYLLTQSNEEE